MEIQNNYINYGSSMLYQTASIEVIKDSSELMAQSVEMLLSGVSEVVNYATRPGIGVNLDVYA